MAIAGALGVAACGGGNETANPVNESSGITGGGGTTTTGNSGASTASGTVRVGSCNTGALEMAGPAISASYGAPLVFPAQPGPITATLLATPAPNNTGGSFVTYYGVSQDVSQNTRLNVLGITSQDSVGKIVTTISIPNQAAGVPIIFAAHMSSGCAVFGALITTGWITENNFSCCDGSVKAPAHVSFGANNTAIVSFGSRSHYLPDTWADNPLRIELTNVTSSPRSSIP